MAYSSYAFLGTIGTYLALLLVRLVMWARFKAKNQGLQSIKP
ncbi:hypothetical protein [Lysinibacillus fusiformis]